jgi:hypothetical protein
VPWPLLTPLLAWWCARQQRVTRHGCRRECTAGRPQFHSCLAGLPMSAVEQQWQQQKHSLHQLCAQQQRCCCCSKFWGSAWCVVLVFCIVFSCLLYSFSRACWAKPW